MLTFVTVNIGAASLDRARRILEWLLERPEEVIILTETSAGAGTAYLLDAFRQRGRTVVHRAAEGDRGVAIVSKVPGDEYSVGLRTLPHRAVALRLYSTPATVVVGLYVPSRDATQAKIFRKRSFLESFQERLRQIAKSHPGVVVLGGDYNLVYRGQAPGSSRFYPFEYEFMGSLARMGFADAHHAVYGEEENPGSWRGRTGEYRYDYFHTKGVPVAVSEYLDASLTFTDHSAVRVGIDVDATVREDEEMALF